MIKFILCLTAFLIFTSCNTEKILKPSDALKAEGADCFNHADCASGVCDHYKAESGLCAPLPCAEGEKSDNNNFYCTAENQWKKTKQSGEACKNDYECYKPTCFMNPACELSPVSRTTVRCAGNVCLAETAPDECEAKGFKRALDKNFYTLQEDGRCFESMEQRILPTVCINCGNGVCEEKESKCNCKEDCGG